MKKLLVFICLALCMLLLVCSCGGNDTDTNTATNTDTAADTNSDTNTDTSTDTDTDTDVQEEKYRVFVCNEAGEGIADAVIQYCLDTMCQVGFADANGYLEIPSSEYHIQRVDDAYEVYESAIYPDDAPLHFEDGSKLITIVLKAKAE